MSSVIVHKNDLDSAIKKFKNVCSKSGVLSELKKRAHYEKPSVKRKNKSNAARKKMKKNKRHYNDD
ncbi:MAG: 30S ribosomal protein S21 [Clostridiales bacterium]|jgi:small subunit ribosomal protein S21|nr:30S ribosomal protein S21 [Clostridiales bacterium]